MAKKAKQAVNELLSHRFVKEILGVYLFLIFVIYPLYYEDAYYNMGDAKWNFFRTVTYYFDGPLFAIPTFLVFLLAAFIWYQIDLLRKNEIGDFWKKDVTITDKFVLFYLIACLFSTVISPYKEFIIWGYEGWYMGMIAQFAFCALYFFVSRFWRWDDLMMVVYMAAATVVNLLGVLNRFNVDPLGMYEGLEDYYKAMFLSTLGQATWYSSYVMIIFPIGIYMYWNAEKQWVRRASFLYLVIGFMTCITQDSDSAFLALGATLITLFCFSFRDNRCMERFLEVILIMLLSWRFTGLLQILFPEQAMVLGGLMSFGSLHPFMWVPIIIFGAVYFLFKKKDKEGKIDITSYTWIRTAVLIGLLILLIAYIIFAYLNTIGALPESLRSDNWYLVFDEYWGNNRGSSWAISIDCIFKTLTNDPLRFIFGAGPDGFYNTAYTYHAEELFAKWGENTILTCAHNEWITQVINIGIVGGIAYLGIFVSAFICFTKKSETIPELIAPTMCIAAYFAHNFFCYQQIICTPIIFIIIGAGISIVRTGGLRAIYEAN